MEAETKAPEISLQSSRLRQMEACRLKTNEKKKPEAKDGSKSSQHTQHAWVQQGADVVRMVCQSPNGNKDRNSCCGQSAHVPILRPSFKSLDHQIRQFSGNSDRNAEKN